MASKAQIFDSWFRSQRKQAKTHVISCVIDVGPISSEYTLTLDGDLKEPTDAPDEAKAFLKSVSVTYPPIRAKCWDFRHQRDVPEVIKGRPHTKFVFQVYDEEFRR